MGFRIHEFKIENTGRFIAACNKFHRSLSQMQQTLGSPQSDPKHLEGMAVDRDVKASIGVSATRVKLNS